MKIKSLLHILIFLVTIGLLSCTKVAPTGPTGPNETALAGNLTGVVSYYSVSGEKMLNPALGGDAVQLLSSDGSISRSTTTSTGTGLYTFTYLQGCII